MPVPIQLPPVVDSVDPAVGVPVTLELYRGMTHDFIKMGRVLKEAIDAQQAAAEAMKGAWNP